MVSIDMLYPSLSHTQFSNFKNLVESVACLNGPAFPISCANNVSLHSFLAAGSAWSRGARKCERDQVLTNFL